MLRMDTVFLLLAAGCLLPGVGLGVYMGIAQDHQLAAVHAHFNLVGWASLALFGVIYRVYPELAASRLARIHFILAAPSAPLFPIGIYLASVHHIYVLVMVSSLAWFAGTLVFFVGIARLAFMGPEAVALPRSGSVEAV